MVRPTAAGKRESLLEFGALPGDGSHLICPSLGLDRTMAPAMGKAATPIGGMPAPGEQRCLAWRVASRNYRFGAPRRAPSRAAPCAFGRTGRSLSGRSRSRCPRVPGRFLCCASASGFGGDVDPLPRPLKNHEQRGERVRRDRPCSGPLAQTSRPGAAAQWLTRSKRPDD